MTRQEKPRRRGRRVALWAALVLVLLLGVSVAVLRTQFHGPALARLVANTLNETMRGRIEIGSIEWRLGGLIDAVAGRFVPLVIDDVKIYDDRGVLVLDAPRIEAKLHAHSLMFGDHIYVVEDIVVSPGAYARLEEVDEPYPLHAYDSTVVSIISAMYSRLEPQFRAGITATKGTVFDLRHYDIRDATIDFVYPTFSARTEHVNGKGFLYSDARDPLSLKLYYSLRPTAPTGAVTVGDLEVPLADIDVKRLDQLPTSWPREPIAQNVEWDLRTGSPEGAKISVSGGIYDFWDDVFFGDYKVAATVENAGPLVNRLSAGLASGDALRLELAASGPFIRPTYRVQLSGLELAIPISAGNPPLPLAIDRATAVFDDATEEGYVEDTIARGAGGAVSLATTFGLSPWAFDLSLKVVEPLQLAPYLPIEVSRLLGTTLSGSIHAFGDGKVQEVDDLDLSFGRARLTGHLVREKENAIHAKRLTLSLGRSSLTSRGVFDVVDQTLDMRVALESKDLDTWLRRAGAPALATNASGTGTVRGSVNSPRGTFDLQLGGVPILGDAAAALRYADGQLEIPRISGVPLGGTLSGEARIDLAGTSPVIDKLRLDGRNLDLSKIPGYGAALGGRATLEIDARGPSTALDAAARVTVANASILGEAYSELAATASLSRGGDASVVIRAERQAGGRLDAEASIDRRDQLAGALSLRSLPIETLIPGAESNESPPVGGVLSAELQLMGTTAKPAFEGSISLVQSWLAAAFIGAADLDIERVADGLLYIRGSLLQGRVRFDGTIATAAPYEVDLSVAMQRVEVDQFLPEEALAFGARAWITGEMHIKTELFPRNGYRPEIGLRLTETVVLVDSTDAQGRTLPIRLRNKAPITLAFDGVTATLMEPALFESPAGDITVLGGGTAEAIDLQLRGALTAQLARPYLREVFDDISGKIDLDVKMSGSFAAPAIAATLDFSKLSIRPVGQDAMVSVDGGRIQVTNHQLAFTGFNVDVTDPFTGERARLTLAGGIKLKDWAPALWAVRIDGQLAGKMLLVAAPRAFSQASGLADVSVSLLGAGDAPSIDGTISFESDTPLSLTPRGLRRELTFTEGQVSFTDQEIELDNVGGRIDEDGRFRDVRGALSLEDWQPVDIDVTMSADAVPFRVPQTLDLTMNLYNLRVVGGGAERLDISGGIELVDGRYIRNFQVDEFFRSDTGGGSSRPFYEDVPLLANANLDLLIDARAFYVANNIANAEFSGQVKVTGTPAQPRLGGQIEVNQGDFRIPGMRARFTRSRGGVVFSPLQRFPEDTPILDITSEADFRDRNGQDHLITLTIQGSLQSMKWDLYTSTGLTKSQTIAMLLSGRTPEEFRKSLGDEAPGSRDPTRFDTSTSSADNFYDQVVRDLAGDFISKLLEDTLKNFTKLDVARLEIGAGSVAFHGEERVFKNLRFLGDFERSLRGQTWNVRGQLRLSDELSVEGEIVNKTFDDESEQDIDDKRLRLVYRRLFFP